MTLGGEIRGRGRPKKLKRERVVEVAMQSYWSDGIAVVSLNEICRRANVSKPAVYREFGNEDGVMSAALAHYYQEAMKPVKRLFGSEIPLWKLLDDFSTYISRDKGKRDNSAGCLFAKLCYEQHKLGPATKRELDRIRRQMREMYEARLARAKETGELSTDISIQTAARYIDAQMLNLYAQKARGEDPKAIREIARIAFSVLV